MGYIDRSYSDGTSGTTVLLILLVSNFVLCLFMLIPVRLAYWVEESMKVLTVADRCELRLSLLLSGISLIWPVLQHYINIYFR